MGKMFDEMMQLLRCLPDDGEELALLADQLEQAHREGDLDRENALIRKILLHRAQNGTQSTDDRQEDGEQPDLTRKEQAYLDEADEKLRQMFDREEWRCVERYRYGQIPAYKLIFRMRNCRLATEIRVDSRSRVCALIVTLPVTADPVYAYPLCKYLARLNCHPTLGMMCYDERDGEVSYRFVCPMEQGLDTDVLEEIICGAVIYVDEQYDQLRKYCVGKFKTREVKEILEEVDALSRDLTDDEA